MEHPLVQAVQGDGPGRGGKSFLLMVPSQLSEQSPGEIPVPVAFPVFFAGVFPGGAEETEALAGSRFPL